MRSAFNHLAVFRHSRKLLIQFLSLVLIVSSLSAISIVKVPEAKAATVTATGTNSAVCNQEVTNTPDNQNNRLDAYRRTINSIDYCVIEFRNTTQTTWNKPAGVTSIDFLVVGGGGGGGSNAATGGGGGGSISGTLPLESSTTALIVAVGAGGDGAPNNTSQNGSGGGSSRISTVANATIASASGGSGGQGWRGLNPSNTSRAVGGNTFEWTPDVVNRSTNFGGGGGMGSTTAGSVPQTGENGPSNSITGDTYGFGAGGGGGVYGPGSGGAGGSWSGGAGGSSNVIGSNGGDLGAGGGGGGDNNRSGGNGAKGIVIFRYVIPVTVTFNSNYGTPTTTTQSIPNNTATGLTANSFTRTGYTFAGWDAAADGSGPDYTNQQSVTIASNMTLYAKWTEVACTKTETSSGGYTIEKITQNGSCVWTTPSGVTAIEVAVIAGGGGGGFGSNAGGGGAGEVLVTGSSAVLVSASITSTSTIATTAGSKTVVTVGAGGTSGAPNGDQNGAGAEASWLPGGDGGASSFGSITANGGGGGGGGGSSPNVRANGAQGGSGGGAASNGTGGSAGTNSTPSNWKSFRNAGSNSAVGGFGGGGGAGGAGLSHTGSVNVRSGGLGVTLWGSKYAGGGGSWQSLGAENNANDSVLGGNGRLSESGNVYPYAGTSKNTSAGVANTGTGGGGGAPGGSGVVVIRYVNAPAISQSNISGTVNSAISSYSITNSGGPITSYSINPALTSNGTLSFSTSTGLISGTPTATLASTNYEITATNSSGTSTTTFSLAINHPACSPNSDTSSSPGYTILKFTSIGTCAWTTPDGVTAIEVAVIAGGGGGGFGNNGAGGGAGEVLVTGSSATLDSASNTTVTTTSTISATPGSTTVVTVGAGGSSGAGTNPTSAGTSGTWTFGGNGSASSFGEVTATGGGGGGGGSQVAGAQGGSGGGGATGGSGGAAGTNTAPAGWKSFRNSGSGNGYGAGGGAGSAGAFSRGGRGITLWGNNRVAGGGGGWTGLGSEGDLSDTLLGGNGRLGSSPYAYAGTSNNTSAGVANTGTGGGGGAPGGSGVVIVRYVNGGAAAAAITTQPSGAVSRSALTTQPVIRIVDGNGTTVTSSTVNVVASITSGNGTLTGTTTVAAVNGIATFTNLVITGTGNHTLTFTPTSLTAVTSSSFAVSNTVITANALTSKVTAPVRAATPSTTAVDDTQYSGTVAWFESNGTTAAPSTFAANTVYIAKVTLTAKTGYTLTGLTGTFTYTDATSVSYSSGVVTITFAATDLTPRTISFATTSYSKTYLDTQVVTATPSLGSGTITYSVGSSTACTISGSTVTISSGTGTCSVSATIASDGTYASATTVTSVTFTIAKGLTTVSISAPAYTFTGSPQGPDGATKTGSTGAITYAYVGRDGTSYTSSDIKPTNVGTYTVTVTVATDNNFASNSTSQNFAISNASLVITPTISASSMVYGTAIGSLPTISHTKNPNVSLTTNPTCALYLASDTGFVTAQSLSSTLAVGSYVVRCSGAALTNYTITYGTNPTFSVTKANQSAISSPVLSATSKTFPFSQTSLSVNSVTGGSGDGAISISSVANGTATGCALSGSTLSASTSGTCTLTITKAASANFEAATTTATFTFNKATPTFSAWSNVSKSFGDSAFTVTPPGVTDSVAGSLAYSSGTTGVISIVGTTLTVAGVGTSVITATFTPTDTVGYNSATTTMTVTVSTGAQTITRTSTSPTSPVKNGTYTPSATASSGLPVVIAIATSSSSVCSISAGVVTFNTVGSCVIEYNQSGNSSYAVASQVSETLTIGKATPTFSTWSDVSKSFGDANFTITAPSVAGSLPGSFAYSSATSSVISISGTTLTVAGAGSSVITATFTPTDGTNFNNATITMTVTVSTRAITITVGSPASTAYTGSAVSVTNSFTVTTGSLAGSNAISGMTYTYTSAGGYNSTTAPTAVGTYTITGSNATFSNGVSTNYVITYVTGSLTITSATQSINFTSTAPTTAKVAGSTYALTATGGASGNAVTFASTTTSVCTVATATVSFIAVGSCTIAANQAATSNYAAATQATQTFTVAKGDPTFSNWSNVSKTFGDANFTITAPTVTGSLAGTFSYASATTSVISISGTTLTVASGGTSVITATFTPTDTTNYNNATTTMTVTVSAATQTVTWAPTTSLLTTASPATPSTAATTSGNGGISYSVTSAGTTGCAVNSSTGVLTFTTSGSCEVTATAAATASYATANRAVTFVISLATRTLTIDSGSFTSTYTMIATPPTIAATASVGTGTKTFSSSTASVCTINSTSGLVAFVSVGTCTIAASIAADSTYGSATSSSISFTTTLAAALTPTFGTPTATADGFTVTITNYSSSYTWAGTATASGTVSVNSSGLVTVTGVAAGTSSTATITTTRTNYTGGTANVSGTSIPVFTITYAAGTGGSGSAPTTPTSVSFGATFVAPANTFIKSGFTFAGWNDGSATYLAAATYPSTGTVSGNVTLTATWTGNICSPTSVTSGGYTRYTFTSTTTCFWDVPDGVSTVDVLAVAGGSGGGYSWDNTGAGGGAGGQVISTSTTLIGTVTVSVGAGGAGGTTSSRRGSSGSNTSIATVTALAGSGGCAARSTCSVTSQATAIAGANGGAGGVGGASGRGGGGSSTVALAPTTTTGGTGTSSNYSGSSVTYGVGGAGGSPQAFGSNIAGVSAGANTGNGGGGASAKNSSGDVNGGAGGSGLIIVRVANANTVVFDSNTGSGTMTDQSIVSGTATALTSNTFTKTGYTFAGWNTNADGTSGTNYSNGQSVTITAGMTLFAKWTLNTYAITFNANNGTGIMGNQSFTHGVAFNLNANLYSRANYVFHRWATAADGTGTTYNNLAQVTLTAATTLYAQWTANTYVVTYSYNGGDGGDSTATSSFTTAGTAITLPVPTRTGFTFAGWHSDAALTTAIGSNNGSGTYSPTGATLSLNAYAKWTAIDYTFTYNANSAGSGTVPTETSKQITQTATVKANTGSLERAGYTFSGWNTASNGTGTNYLSGSLFTVGSANVVLYAKWSANTYTITYNANGGSGDAQRSSANVSSDNFTTGGSPVVLPDAGTLTRTGYTFGGWNTSAAGTGTNYAATNTYTTVSNVIFYAKWNPITYTITYNGNTSDGGSAPTTGGYTTGQASPYLVLANSFTKTSSIFGGWNTANNRTGTNYSPGASITTLADIVLYAIWIPQYTLHYAINGGTVTSGSLPADASLTENTSVNVFSSVGRTGYTFDGWTNGASTIAPGGSFNILQNSVLTAKWTAINYTVSYNSDGGTTPPSSITRQIGQSYTIGNASSKPGHDFLGWKTGTTVVGAGASIVMGSSDVTYTAQWAAQIYQISYDWNGGRGTAVADVNYTFGTTAITLPLVGDRVRDGYTFAGWSESLGGSALSATYTPSQSRTLYALWTVGNFTVTYNLSGGTLANNSVSVQNGSATVLPLPTRANFVFDGWHTATTGGSSVGSNGASFTPTASQTIYARWIQASLYGITNSLTRIGSVVTVANVANTFSGANSSSSVAVSIPENALPAGTTINFDMVGNSSRAVGLLPNVAYLVSIAVSWLAGDGTVPDTASGKPISVTISNATIKAGATAYAIVNNVSTLLGTASQDGTITIALTSDPEVVVAAVKPGAPTNVAATSNGNQQSVISWSAPSSNGGSAITGYTVTSSPGTGTCTTSTTSCTISSLANGTAYTFTVTATNGVGTSVASTSASATTAALYAVTFDAKSGTTVTNGSFLTASTVSEPTAPTRTGYSFAGWSATDGGSVVTFPYAPGVTIAITMYARWDALDNAVTFDSKSGSSVASAIFSSGGTVAEPTAPTRTGYTFAGWSATDGGSAVTFPYAPGVVTDITLYAKWTVVSQNNSSGSGGGSSNPVPSTPTSSEPVAPVKSNVTVVAPVIVVGDQDAKIIAVDIATPAPGSNSKPPLIKVDKASEKFIAQVKVVEGKLVLTPETGFSGKKTVSVTITENGTDRIIQIPLTVLPEAVTKPVFTPTAYNKSIIRWTESLNADGYTVFLNGKRVCTITALSCSVKTVLGPNAKIEVIANGGDRTVSQRVGAEFRQNVPVPITRLVSATITKATLTKVDTKALDKVVALIKNQGFGTVVISEITTTSKTKALAAARIESIKKYITSKIGTEEVVFEVTPVKSRTYFNNISVKG